MAGGNQLAIKKLGRSLDLGQPRKQLVTGAGLKPRINILKIKHTDYSS